MDLLWKGRIAFLHMCPSFHSRLLTGEDMCRLAMAAHRSRKTMQQQVGGLNSGTDSVDEQEQEEEQEQEGDLTPEQWHFLDGLDRVGERLPTRGRDGSLPAWGGMDFREMTVEQQTVYLVSSLTKVAVECALVIDEEGADQDDSIMSFTDMLHELDNAVHVPLGLKDVREQEFGDRCIAMVEEINGTRKEVMKNAENNISALAVELQTAR